MIDREFCLRSPSPTAARNDPLAPVRKSGLVRELQSNPKIITCIARQPFSLRGSQRSLVYVHIYTHTGLSRRAELVHARACASLQRSRGEPSRVPCVIDARTENTRRESRLPRIRAPVS